ncbi:tyrosine-type recombinase/integrase [Stenotrophomonas maltophilia]|uniref:tyrosine-type recombinase/integrase n=1 Tax=Stenotrophomonas maltophilia TaxID=40324 RepID=UPI0013DA5EC4|nr:site-specific integrase [Stenotrophomonas maltophilia]
MSATDITLKRRSPGGPFYVHFAGNNGERMRISTGKSIETEARAEALRIVNEHLMAPSAAPAGTLGDALKIALEHVWRGQKSEPEKRKLVGKIMREIGHWPRDLITHDRLRDYLDSLQVGTAHPKPMKAATKNRYVSAISTALGYAYREDSTYRVPKLPSWAENNVKERYLTQEEEQRLLGWFADNTAPGMKERSYLWHLVILLLDTGMRATEALEVMTKDRLVQDREGDWLVHLPHGDTKSGRGRMVPLTPRASHSAREMLASPIHGRWTSQNAGRALQVVMLKLGINGVTLHTLRHTTASRLIQSGEEIYTVAAFLGHSSVEVTKRYAHLSASNLKGAMKKLQSADVPPSPDGNPKAEAQALSSGTQNGAKLYVVK